jgi:hypothetical protein
MSSEAIVSIEPAAFKADDEITLTFNAKQGNRELMGAEKVYVHTGVGTVKTNAPQSTAWNKVVGDWGLDNGKGLMTEVEEDVWQITFVPKTFYGLTGDEFPYWLACVFRNANGTVKGTAAAGEFENGIIASNGDIFVRNLMKTSVDEAREQALQVFPNPADQVLNFAGFDGQLKVKIFNSLGALILSEQIPANTALNVELLEKGIYFYQVETLQDSYNGRFLKR